MCWVPRLPEGLQALEGPPYPPTGGISNAESPLKFLDGNTVYVLSLGARPTQVQPTVLMNDVSSRPRVLVGTRAYRPTVGQDRLSTAVQATSKPDSWWTGKVPDL